VTVISYDFRDKNNYLSLLVYWGLAEALRVAAVTAVVVWRL